MQNLVAEDGEVFLVRRFYKQDDADRLFLCLQQQLVWQEELITIVGKQVKVPRLTCWYGDPGANYRYSGVLHKPLTWTDDLQAVRKQLEVHCAESFNSVLANLYRNGKDSMGWHADKEKSLGKNPYIASLNFGAARLFKLQHNKGRQILNIELRHGDLLLMGGTLQHHWRHSVPKSRELKAARINLTFRNIRHLDVC